MWPFRITGNAEPLLTKRLQLITEGQYDTMLLIIDELITSIREKEKHLPAPCTSVFNRQGHQAVYRTLCGANWLYHNNSLSSSFDGKYQQEE